MSRAKVIRLLASAREVGMVRMRVDARGSERVALERGLVASFGRAEAIVAPAPASVADVARVVGRAAGAVGDVLCHFIDAQGEVVDHPFNRRVVELEDLRRVPRIVVAAGGRRKVAAIRAALKATGASVLITEEAAARGLLAG